MLLLIAYGGMSAGDEPAVPLPFDPLTPAEEQHAIHVARSDPLVAVLLVREEPIGAALNTDKDRLLADPGSRAADVWFYDYATDLTVWALVDLTKDVVRDRATATYQPPITASESEQAAALALADPRVEEALAHHRESGEIGTMARLWTGDAPTTCPVNRCALVAFTVDGVYEPEPLVRVNLSRGVVEALLSHAPGDDGHDHSHGEVA